MIRIEPVSRFRRTLFAHRGQLAIFALFLGFFLLLLASVPLSGSLLGSVDSLFIPALSNALLNRFRSVLFGEFVGRSMYPADVFRYGETGIGLGGMFMLLRILGLSNVYAQYLLQVLQLALMAHATFLLAREYRLSPTAAAFSALAFTTANFVWADIDHLPIHFYFLPLLCMMYVKRAADRGRSSDLTAAAVLGGLQMYFSVQVFVYQSIMVTLVVAANLQSLRRRFSTRGLLVGLAKYAIVPLPLLAWYLDTVLRLGIAEVWQRAAVEQYLALQLPDFLSALPHKPISYPFIRTTEFGIGRVAHSAFLGLGAPALAVVGVWRMRRGQRELLAIGLVGLLFALGTVIRVGGTELTSPLRYFYEYVPFAGFLRVALRSYSLFVLTVSLCAGIGLDWLAAAAGRVAPGLPAIAFVLATGFVLAENISWPLNEHEIIPYPSVPPGYVEYFQDKPEALILDLPSQSTSWPGLIDEIIYMLWQAEHKRNILGGVNSYYPPTRIEAQEYANLLPSEEAFRYFWEIGVTHFIWHSSRHLVCHPRNSRQGCDPLTGRRAPGYDEAFSWMSSSPYLKVVFADDLVTIYSLEPASGRSK